MEAVLIIGYFVGAVVVAVVGIVLVVLPITGFFMGLAVGAERIAKTRQWESFKRFLAASWQVVRQLPQLRYRLQLRFLTQSPKEEG